MARTKKSSAKVYVRSKSGKVVVKAHARAVGKGKVVAVAKKHSKKQMRGGGGGLSKTYGDSKNRQTGFNKEMTITQKKKADKYFKSLNVPQVKTTDRSLNQILNKQRKKSEPKKKGPQVARKTYK